MAELPNKHEGWLKNTLYGVFAGIQVEPDCETVEDQLARDLFYESQGGDIDLADVERVDITLSDTYEFSLEPFAESPMGIVCKSNELNDENEPEIVFLGGTLFDVNGTSADLEAASTELWPSSNVPFVDDRFYKNRKPVLMNRRIATMGKIAARLTYSPEEFNRYASENDYFVPQNFVNTKIVRDGETLYRAVPRNISVGLTIFNLTMKLHDGSVKIIGP